MCEHFWVLTGFAEVYGGGYLDVYECSRCGIKALIEEGGYLP